LLSDCLKSHAMPPPTSGHGGLDGKPVMRKPPPKPTLPKYDYDPITGWPTISNPNAALRGRTSNHMPKRRHESAVPVLSSRWPRISRR
jgi:hypothetical protein